MENIYDHIDNLLEDRKYLRARRIIQKLLKSNPNDIEALRVYAKSLCFQSKSHESLEICKKLLDCQRKDQYVMKIMVRCYLQNKQFSDAISLISEIEEKGSDDREVAFLHSTYLMLIKDYVEAEIYATNEISRKPEYYLLHKTLSGIYLLSGKNKKGLIESIETFRLHKSFTNFIFFVNAFSLTYKLSIALLFLFLFFSSILLPFPLYLIPIILCDLILVFKMSISFMDNNTIRIILGIVSLVGTPYLVLILRMIVTG